jgi:methyl-accepting chemotaxis protein
MKTRSNIIPLGLSLPALGLALGLDLALALAPAIWMIPLQDLLLVGGLLGLGYALALLPVQEASEIMEFHNEGSRIDLGARLRETRLKPINRLFGAVNKGMQNAEQAIGGIAASAARLVPMSRQLSDTYNAVSQAAIVQNNYSKTVSQGMQDVLDAAQQVFDHAGNIGKAVRHGHGQAEESRQAMEQTVASMQQLARRIGETDEELALLQRDSGRIGDIVEVIDSVSEQTNLLALNAAIEAARAGEQGRGFAVVAEEVRTLAARTRESTREIQDIVDNIRTGTQRVVEAMRLGSEATAVTADNTEESRRKLNDVVASVGEIGNMAEAISRASEQQLGIAREAQTSVLSMMNLNSSAIEGATQQTVGTDDLMKLAYSLRDKLDRFILADEYWDESMRPSKPSAPTPGSSPRPGSRSAPAPSSELNNQVELF